MFILSRADLACQAPLPRNLIRISHHLESSSLMAESRHYGSDDEEDEWYHSDSGDSDGNDDVSTDDIPDGFHYAEELEEDWMQMATTAHTNLADFQMIVLKEPVWCRFLKGALSSSIRHVKITLRQPSSDDGTIGKILGTCRAFKIGLGEENQFTMDIHGLGCYYFEWLDKSTEIQRNIDFEDDHDVPSNDSWEGSVADLNSKAADYAEGARPSIVFLYQMVISKPNKGRGIGKALVDKLFEEVMDPGGTIRTMSPKVLFCSQAPGNDDPSLDPSLVMRAAVKIGVTLARMRREMEEVIRGHGNGKVLEVVSYL